MLNSEVMNRPFVRDITKTCECVCATESNAVGLQNAEPLTLEELRKMKGEPVWIDLIGSGLKTCRIVLEDSGTCFVTVGVGGLCLMTSDYGLKWIAYADKPIHIERSAWKPCEMCGDKRAIKLSCNFSGGAIIKVVGESLEVSGDDKAIPLFKKSYEPAFWIKFCPWCGRPLTDAAWNMLEKRLECTK